MRLRPTTIVRDESEIPADARDLVTLANTMHQSLIHHFDGIYNRASVVNAILANALCIAGSIDLDAMDELVDAAKANVRAAIAVKGAHHDEVSLQRCAAAVTRLHQADILKNSKAAGAA